MKFSNQLFSYESVERCIADLLIPEGYEVEMIPGCLVDNYICYAPDENHYNFLFIESYINEWSSRLAVHKCKKMRKAELEFIGKLRETADSY